MSDERTEEQTLVPEEGGGASPPVPEADGADRVAPTVGSVGSNGEAAGSALLATAERAGPSSVAVASPSPAPLAPDPSPADGNGTRMVDYEHTFRSLSEGDVVRGRVVHIDREGVLVDVGTKSEGLIPPNELSREPGANVASIVSV